jgi:hypothetical protein
LIPRLQPNSKKYGCNQQGILEIAQKHGHKFPKSIQMRESTLVAGLKMDHDHRPRYLRAPSRNMCDLDTQETLGSNMAPWSWDMAPL